MRLRLLALATVACAALGWAAVAQAATVVVSPSNMNGWAFVDDNGHGGTGQLVTGPASPPAGTGSARLALTNSTQGYALGTTAFAGTRLDTITSLGYSSYQPGPTLAISMQFDVKYRPTDVAYGGRLVFEPYQNGTVVVGSGWRTWSPLSGKWWASKTTAAGSNGLCPINAPCTWAAILAAFPNATIDNPANPGFGALLFKAGSNWASFDGNVDNATIGISGSNTTFDFEGPAQCQPGYYSGTGFEPCTAASVGYYVPGTGATSQVACAPGTYQGSTGSSSCISASAGYAVPFAASAAQSPCGPGYWQDQTGQAFCNQAPVGSFAPGPASTTATLCPSGTFSSAPAQASCTPASPGSFASGPGATGQVQCSLGTFQSLGGQSSCDQATPGNYVDTPGATGQSSCAAGYFQSAFGATSCMAATPGHYVGNIGAATQTDCGLGFYQSASGAISCLQSTPGHYVDTATATSQKDCAVGTYQAASGASSCDPATPGHYVDVTGATGQLDCALGTFQAASGASSCNQATPGHYVGVTAASAQSDCDLGTFQPAAGASSCTQATPGYYVNTTASANQTPCPLGSYQPNSGAATCLLADVGYYVDSPGSAGQTKCPAGTTTATTGSTSVAACSGNQAKLDVLNQLNAQIGTYARKQDNDKLKQAAKSLNDSLDPSLWLDANHLVPKQGEKVFQSEKDACQKLSDLLRDKNSGVPDNLLQGWIGTLTAVDRSLAATAIQESTNTLGADAKKLQDATNELNKGDQSAQDNKPDAIEHYKNAWKHALEAVRKL